MNEQSEVITTICKAIEEVTGNHISDIRLDVDLADDLGISLAELTKVMIKTQNQLGIILTEPAKREILEDAETVRDLVEIIEEEYEF